METINIDKETFNDLMKAKEELDLIVESIELMNDPKVMASLRKSNEQIKSRDFADWNELQNSTN